MSSNDRIMFQGKLVGHNGWVTCLATNVKNSNLLVSGGRDNKLIIWDLTRDENSYGYAKKALSGHNHFVSCVCTDSEGKYALSGSWDKTLRLWDLTTGESTRTFVGHSKDVMAVALSKNRKHILSASRDKSIKLWNVHGECKKTFDESNENEAHTNWVSCLAYSPNLQKPILVSGGWDKKVKVWNMKTGKLKTNLIGHKGYVNTVTISPDSSLCASGGKDGVAMLWDLVKGKFLYRLEAGDTINAMAFSPSRFWLCAATPTCVKFWHLKTKKVFAELIPEANEKGKRPECISLCWSPDGTTLFTGYTDNTIRVWGVTTTTA